MRTLLLVFITILSISVLPGCGKKKPSETGSNPEQSASVEPTGYNNGSNLGFGEFPGDGGPTTPPAGPGEPLYSYEFERIGYDQDFTTGNLTTDNTLRVAFEVGNNIGADSGNNTFQASELKVTIEVNGVERSPRYDAAGCPSGGCTYGRASDGRSMAIDFSDVLVPGQPVTIRVKNPFYSFFCEYPYYNPLYMQYPTCYKKVNNPTTANIGGNTVQVAGHVWSGRLIVQTDTTLSLD